MRANTTVIGRKGWMVEGDGGLDVSGDGGTQI